MWTHLAVSSWIPFNSDVLSTHSGPFTGCSHFSHSLSIEKILVMIIAMSKVNRRKEIKEKEELQARFQLLVAQNNKKVLNWLKPVKNDDISASLALVNGSFLQLPIIANGESLSSLDTKSTDEVQRVGDFISSNDTSKFKQIKQESTDRTRSKPMTALMNRIRDGGREKVKTKMARKPVPAAKPAEESDSDDEAAYMKNRTVKKAPVPFGKKQKGRPF